MGILGIGKSNKKASASDTLEFKKLRTVIDKIIGDQKETIDEMNRFLKRYKGEWWNDKALKPSDSTVSANLLFSTVMTVAPLLTDNRPVWSIRARKAYLQNYMEAFSLALEYLWDKLDMDMVSFKWILDALIMKIGIVKCYFDPDAEFGGEVKVDVVDPRTFFCAPGYDDIWEAPLCGTRVARPISWIRMNFPESGAKVKPDGEVKGEYEADDWQMNVDTATVYEVWLKDDSAEDYYVNEEGKEGKKEEGSKKETRKRYPFGRLVVFTPDVLLSDRPMPYKHGKPPYVALYDYINPHELIGQGEGEQIEELNKSFNRNLQLWDNFNRYYNDPPWLLDTNSGLDVETFKTQLLQGGGIFAYNSTVNPNPVQKIQGAAPNPSAVQEMGALKKLVEEISGVTDITKGMTSKSQRQSATEISTLIESSYTRTRQRVRNFEFSVKRVLYQMLELMQQYYTEPRTFSVKRDSNIEYYDVANSKDFAAQTIKPPAPMKPGEPTQEPEYDEQVTKDYEEFISAFGEEDEIHASFDLLVETNSSLPMDKQSLANLYLRLLEMGGGNPVTALPMWKATLTQLRIPRHKDIISEMEKLFAQQSQPPAQGPAGPQGPMPPEGMPGMMEMLQQAGGNEEQ